MNNTFAISARRLAAGIPPLLVALAVGGCAPRIGSPPAPAPAPPAAAAVPAPVPVTPPAPAVAEAAPTPAAKVPEPPPPQRSTLPVEVEAVPPSREPVRAAAAFPVSRTVEMRSTAYCLRGTMRTGVRVRDGMAAADPTFLPLGSVVRLTHPDGRLIGIFVIMDTGGAVRGNKIDIWLPSCREATDWGIRRVVAEVLAIGKV